MLMKPFLKHIAELFYSEYEAGIHRVAFIFPNKRSGLFFRKYLSEIAPKPIFSPPTLTITDLFCKLNTKQPADRVQLLFLLYEIYISESGSDDSFDDFIYWGEMLLRDFDDVDKNLANAKQLFTNVTDLNHIEQDFGFLQPAQIEAIRSFWSSFAPEKDPNQQSFLRVWELLYPIYETLRKRLASEGFAYEGMIYREVIEGFDQKLSMLPYEKIVFVGLNALTKAEKELLLHLKKQDIADFYWDYSSEKLKDESNKASFFMQDNIRTFPSKHILPEEEPQDPSFEVIGVPSRIGQAKMVYSVLNDLCRGEDIDTNEALKTAVVLPDEQLLIPLIHAIPERFSRINITLGYALSGTPIASLMDSLQSLQKNSRNAKEGALFYHRDVIAILRHRYVFSVCPKESLQLIANITERNMSYIPKSFLKGPTLLQLLFFVPATTNEISEHLINILQEINLHHFSAGEERDSSEGETINAKALEKEFMFHYYTIVSRIKEMILQSQTEMSVETYFKLLTQMTGLIKIPFHGEPLSGLQVMGVLETRVLDFENLIIPSMNEGFFPSKNVAASFIPYHLRKGFGLPTPEHQAGIWAYHFYRMIHRAKQVTMIYDTRTDGLRNGEVSRFIQQLKYHYKIPLKQKLSVYNISSSHVAPLQIEKNEEIMQKLSLFETEKSLSASAINIYLDCPLKFYFSVVYGINEEKAITESLENDLFGTILHRTMELAYKPLHDKTITADLLRLAAADKNMTKTIERAFAEDFFHSEEPRSLSGRAYLYGETIRKYVCKVLEYDRSITPFVYVDSEKLVNKTIEISGGQKIKIKGFIDRIDIVNDVVRIVDYKSGKATSLVFDTMNSLFDTTLKDRKKSVMQVFLYAWIYGSDPGERSIQPTVYYTRNIFSGKIFDPSIYQLIDKEKGVVNNFNDYRQEFEACLRSSLNNIFNAGIPFTQTSNIKNCSFCLFAEICNKKF